MTSIFVSFGVVRLAVYPESRVGLYQYLSAAAVSFGKDGKDLLRLQPLQPHNLNQQAHNLIVPPNRIFPITSVTPSATSKYRNVGIILCCCFDMFDGRLMNNPFILPRDKLVIEPCVTSMTPTSTMT